MSVAAHKSSPIYQADHTQTAFALAKAGVLDGEGLLDNVTIPNKDRYREVFREKQKMRAKQLKEQPWLAMQDNAKKPKQAANSG